MDRGDDTTGHGDFLHVLLKLKKEDITIANHHILILMFDMFMAVNETSSTTVNWAMAELMRTPRVMAKTQAELWECRETCKVICYNVPKGTSVLVNVCGICRDPKYWEDAKEFKPERYENSGIDYKGTNFELLLFGSGNRMCPGSNLGIANLELALAR